MQAMAFAQEHFLLFIERSQSCIALRFEKGQFLFALFHLRDGLLKDGWIQVWKANVWQRGKKLKELFQIRGQQVEIVHGVHTENTFSLTGIARLF